MAIEHGTGLNRCISQSKNGGIFQLWRQVFPRPWCCWTVFVRRAFWFVGLGKWLLTAWKHVTLKKGIFGSWRGWKFEKLSWFWLGYYEHLYHSVDHFLWNKLYNICTLSSLTYDTFVLYCYIHVFLGFKRSPQALVARGYCHLQRPDAAKLRKRAQEARENAEKLQDRNVARRVEGAWNRVVTLKKQIGRVEKVYVELLMYISICIYIYICRFDCWWFVFC